jgi:hypothetical protein
MEYRVEVVALTQLETEINALALIGWQVVSVFVHPSASEIEVIVVLSR